MSDLEVTGAENFDRFAANLKTAERAMANKVRKSIRDIAKPIAIEVTRRGAQSMPRRGGFAEQVKDARPLISVTQRGIYMTLRDSQKHDLKALDEGILRHPVFMRSRGRFRMKTGRGKTGHVLGGTERRGWDWVAQRVPAHKFTEAFQQIAEPKVTPRVIAAINSTLNDVGKGL